jgi:hypothetical protein
MCGHDQNAYDVLFRAGTYPDNGIGNVMSGTILQSIFLFQFHAWGWVVVLSTWIATSDAGNSS